MVDQLCQKANQLYQLHFDYLNKLLISQEDCNEEGVEQTVIANALNDLENRLKIKLKANGKISKVLMNQLLRHHLQIGEKYLIQINDSSACIIEYFQSREILEIIELIETRSDRNKRKPFKSDFLKGLEHIHHGAYASRGYSAVKNCIDYWYYNGVLKGNKKIEFQKLINENTQNLAGRMYQIAILSKLKKGLNGEWLIYKRHEGENYFLCLAKHDEGDELIYENKIRPCLIEFPELKKCNNDSNANA